MQAVGSQSTVTPLAVAAARPPPARGGFGSLRSPPPLQQRRRRGGPRAAPGEPASVADPPAAASTSAAPDGGGGELVVWPGVFEGFWRWRGYRIRYHRAGPPPAAAAAAAILVHGFGGNADHWRRNLPVLGAAGVAAFAVDLLGYGYADKPPPGPVPNQLYNFDTWAQQLCDFAASDVVGRPAALVCNSIGGCAGLAAAAAAPERFPAVQVLNISLRMLHVSKQAPWARPAVAALQRALRETPLGALFFAQVATRAGVRSVLRQCYSDKSAVTDELVDVILTPGLEPGALAVFLDFISFSGGPTPEELFAACPRPVSVLWGADDPWEPLEKGRAAFAGYPCVEEFVVLEGAGHCPQDEAPGTVNPLILSFLQRHHPGAQLA